MNEKMKELANLKQLLNTQANDEGLWLNPIYITEDYLQLALRELHYYVEEYLNVIGEGLE